MKLKILYFTRTNTCQRIALKLANQLGVEALQISDHINWNGAFGWLKAGFYSSTNRPVSVELPTELDAYQQIILVAPLWAGGIAPAARDVIRQLGRAKVRLVVASDASTVKDRDGYISVHDVINSEKNEEAVIKEITTSLSQKP